MERKVGQIGAGNGTQLESLYTLVVFQALRLYHTRTRSKTEFAQRSNGY